MQADTEATVATPRHITIRHRWTGATLYECDIPADVPSGMEMRHALEQSTAGGADLRDADLRGADLGGADLGGADLRGADLRDADLRGADLRDADLRGANLGDADLRGADLGGANLRDANLGDADLRGADLGGADLRDANLGDADLLQFKADFFEVLLRAPAEIAALRAALVEGRVDGSTYEGSCACLVGTIANARGADYRLMPGIEPSSSRPAEQWFMQIGSGDTPETNRGSAQAVEWVDEFVALLDAAVASRAAP